MALFTDGLIAGLNELKAYESGVLDVACREKIDATAKLQVAQRELGIEIAGFLLRQGIAAANLNELSNVVVTEQMLHVHVLHALKLIYRDAYSGQPNDTYKTKWHEYDLQAQRSMYRLFDAGVGLAAAPLQRPETPMISAISGGTLPARYCFVSVAWTGGGGGRSALSVATAIALDPGNLLSVSAPPVSPGASGWVVYAGETEGSLWLQTPEALNPEQVWIEPSDGLRRDLPDRPEQTPDYYVAKRRLLLRG